jgi:hypothetical protein
MVGACEQRIFDDSSTVYNGVKLIPAFIECWCIKDSWRYVLVFDVEKGISSEEFKKTLSIHDEQGDRPEFGHSGVDISQQNEIVSST